MHQGRQLLLLIKRLFLLNNIIQLHRLYYYCCQCNLSLFECFLFVLLHACRLFALSHHFMAFNTMYQHTLDCVSTLARLTWATVLIYSISYFFWLWFSFTTIIALDVLLLISYFAYLLYGYTLYFLSGFYLGTSRTAYYIFLCLLFLAFIFCACYVSNAIIFTYGWPSATTFSNGYLNLDNMLMPFIF